MSWTFSRRPATGRPLGRIVALALTAILALAMAGCASRGGATAGVELLHYQRVWPDGRVEQQTIYTDGRVEMRHGEVLERMTIRPTDIARIQDALQAPIPTGSAEDSPERTLTLADGTVVAWPRPDPGTVTELMEELLNTHGLS
jgi:hypothetical protein